MVLVEQLGLWRRFVWAAGVDERRWTARPLASRTIRLDDSGLR